MILTNRVRCLGFLHHGWGFPDASQGDPVHLAIEMPGEEVKLNFCSSGLQRRQVNSPDAGSGMQDSTPKGVLCNH